MEFIAELGSNPRALNWETLPYLRAAKESGATGVKVQLFRAEHFPESERTAKRADEFPRGTALAVFVGDAHANGLRAGASVFDPTDLNDTRSLDFLKLAQREQHNLTLIWEAMKTGKPFYRSLYRPNRNSHTRYIPLWTVPLYPTPMGVALLNAVAARNYFRVCRAEAWGWSSHTRGILDSVIAARLGAAVIEKHLALLPSDPEAGHSMSPRDFERLTRACR